MSSGDNIKVRLENFKSYMYNEIQYLISKNTEALQTKDFVDTQKYKPTKHQRAHKIKRNFKKRCYAR